AFNAKGVHAELNLRIPVKVVTTERLGLLGAALLAAHGR
ncbi:MAG: glucokinase, partial [Burkholderiales bacterium]|nr:glucokinase [Burkholderiales bacterium]